MAWLPAAGARAWLGAPAPGGGTADGFEVSYDGHCVTVARPSPFCGEHWQVGAFIIPAAAAHCFPPGRQRRVAEVFKGDLRGIAAGFGCCPACIPGAAFDMEAARAELLRHPGTF